MAKYTFTAKSKAGQMKSGKISAANEQAAVGILQQRGLVVTSLKKEAASESKIYGKVSQKDLVIFTREFAIMLSAGVTITQSLRILAEQTQNTKLQSMTRNIQTEVESGTRLSDALDRYPKTFTGFYIAMIRSGEASGRLDQIMNQLADQIEKDYYLMSSVRSALIYPTFILVMLLGIGMYLVGAVIPQLSVVYEEFGAELPAATKGIISIGNFLNAYWWLMMIVLVVFGFVMYRYVKSAEGKRAWDGYKLRIPFIGPLIIKIASTRFTRNLSTLIVGDIPIVEALNITSEISGNSLFEESVRAAADDVRNGMPLSEALAKNAENNIPPITIQMIAVGEETGKLDKVLTKIADFFNEEIDRTITTMSALIEPVTIVFLGVGVAVLIAAVLMPIYNLVNVI